MSETLRNIALTYKNQLISRDLNTKKEAILGIKECLQTVKSDSFVKVILDLDVQIFLLNVLIKSDYSLSPEILKCIELLCSYKIYFTRDCAVNTAEIILRNLFNLVKDHKFDNVVVDSLKIITTIIENLDDYYSKNNLNFSRYLETVRNLLINKDNPLVIKSIIIMFGALLLHEKFQKKIDDKIFNDIEEIWQLGLEKLKEIFTTFSKCSVVGTSKLCDSILRMLQKIKNFKKENIEKFYENVKDVSVKCLTFVCIPYFAEFGLKSKDICVEYLCFLKTVLKSNLTKDTLVTISKKLVQEINFTVITKYLDKITSNPNTEDKDSTRQLCLMIICEIIVNLSDMTICPYTEEKCKKYMFKHIQTIKCAEVSEWLNLLNDPKVSVDTKLVLIKFCTVYYVDSQNLCEIKPEHLYSFVEFLKNFPPTMNVNICFLKDLWLLFTVVFCLYPEGVTNDYSLFKATATLERLILSHEESFDKLLTYHLSVVSWIFMDRFVKKELMYAVMNRWLLYSTTNAPAYSALIYAVSQWHGAAALLLGALERGEAPHATAAAGVLRTALTQGPLKHDPEFVQLLCSVVPYNIERLAKGEIIRDKVISCIYMLHLSSYVPTPVDRSLLEYSVNAIIGCVGSLGLSDLLPSVFYAEAFDYANTILGVAKTNQITQVFLSFMNSEPLLYTLMTAFISDNRELSIKASKIFNSLLDYQTYHRIYCRNTMIIKKDFLVKLFSVRDIEQLQLNLQILKTLLFKTAKSVLHLEIDEKTLKGLYYRCLNLVSKPGKHNLAQFGLKCLEGILRYSHIHNLECHSYLCQHTGNHVLILTFFDKETSRPIDRTFLSFVQCWLQFASKDKEKIYNKLSIEYTFWKISFFQIADLILGDTVESKSENVDVVNSILRQLLIQFHVDAEKCAQIGDGKVGVCLDMCLGILWTHNGHYQPLQSNTNKLFQFSDLLPTKLANYLQCIIENLNE